MITEVIASVIISGTSLYSTDQTVCLVWCIIIGRRNRENSILRASRNRCSPNVETTGKPYGIEVYFHSLASIVIFQVYVAFFSEFSLISGRENHLTNFSCNRWNSTFANPIFSKLLALAFNEPNFKVLYSPSLFKVASIRIRSITILISTKSN